VNFCSALERATHLYVSCLPITSLRASLESLRRSYDLDPSRRWYEPVTEVTRALYALEAERHIAWLEPTREYPGRSIIDFHTIVVFHHRDFCERLVALVTAHPAFRGAQAGPYQFDPDSPAWAAYSVLRDLGFRPVFGTEAPYYAPTNAIMCPLSYDRYYFSTAYSSIVHQLREICVRIPIYRAAVTEAAAVAARCLAEPLARRRRQARLMCLYQTVAQRVFSAF
jgi:hypothetical protein